MDGAIVFVEGTRPKVSGFCYLGGEVGFADPGALLVRQDDGDGVMGCLESSNEGVDVR